MPVPYWVPDESCTAMENFLNCVYLVFERVNDFQSERTSVGTVGLQEKICWTIRAAVVRGLCLRRQRKDMQRTQDPESKRLLPQMLRKRYTEVPGLQLQESSAQDKISDLAISHNSSEIQHGCRRGSYQNISCRSLMLDTTEMPSTHFWLSDSGHLSFWCFQSYPIFYKPQCHTSVKSRLSHLLSSYTAQFWCSQS